MNLEENFIKYKDVTLTIMELVKAEDYENLDKFFKQRQLILDDIAKLNGSKEELQKFYFQYDINSIEKTLALEMESKKGELLKKIKENQKRKIAMNGYNNLQARAVFLSREF